MEATAPQPAPAPRPDAPAAPGMPLAGIAAVAVAVALLAINTRMDDEWGTGIFFVLNGLAAAALLGVGIMALTANTEDRPSGDTTAVLVAGYVMLALWIGNLADILGAEGGSGSTFWTTLLFASIVAYPAWVLRSPVSALFDALASGIAFLAFIDWVFDYESFQTLRWLLVILILAYAGSSVIAAGVSDRHGVQLVNAAGIAALVFAVTVFLAAAESQFGSLLTPFGTEPDTGGPVGWEFLALVAGMGLVAYGAIRREPGPAYLGGLTLLFFVLAAALPGDDGPSLIGWPIVLLLLAIAASAAAAVLRD